MSDYYYDVIPYLYNKFRSTDEYFYTEIQNTIVVETEDLPTYERMWRKWSPTPFDPTRRRAFGTRIRRPKTTVALSKMPEKPKKHSGSSAFWNRYN